MPYYIYLGRKYTGPFRLKYTENADGVRGVEFPNKLGLN